MNRFMKSALLLLLAAGVVGTTVPSFAAEYLVKYRNQAALQMFSAGRQVQVLDVHDKGQLMKVEIADNKKVPAMVQLFSDPNIEYVVPNAKLHAFSAPVDMTALKDQWAIAKVQAEKAWALAGNKGSKNVLVAVIDTGVDYKHKSLAPNMVPGYDFVQNDNDPMDVTGQNPGHGTHCAGIVGSTGLVDQGTTGLSPEVSIMPIRFLDQNGSGNLDNGIKAIDYAIEKGVQVISASWGAAIPRDQAKPLIEAIARAEKAGVVFVVAASNDGKNNDSYEVYPANAGLSNTISVAASNSSDGKPSWSNYGRKSVQLSSPGDGIMSTLPKDKYGNLSGTSMATPLVAGLVAFLKAQDPKLTPMELRSLMQSTGSKVGIETACDCRIDALSAVETIKSQKLFISPFAGAYAVGDNVQFEGVYGKGPYQFASSNASVATIDASGMLTAVADGETQVSVTDAAGVTATSYKIIVGKASSGGTPPSDPSQPGQPGEGECPIGDPQTCQAMCQIMPDLPWCNAN